MQPNWCGHQMLVVTVILKSRRRQQGEPSVLYVCVCVYLVCLETQRGVWTRMNETFQCVHVCIINKALSASKIFITPFVM